MAKNIKKHSLFKKSIGKLPMTYHFIDIITKTEINMVNRDFISSTLQNDEINRSLFYKPISRIV